MKKFISVIVFLMAFFTSLCAQYSWSRDNQQASLTLSNRSEYSLTIKVMRYSSASGRFYVYSRVYVSPYSSRTITFSESESGTFYTKSKAEKPHYDPVYMEDENSFRIVNNGKQYTTSTIEYYVSSGYGTGQRISASEFEKDY